MSEHGLIEELYKQAAKFFNSKFKHEFRTFRTVKEYLDEYILVKNLSIQNFRFTLVPLFFIEMLLSLCFIFSFVFYPIRLYENLKKKFKKNR